MVYKFCKFQANCLKIYMVSPVLNYTQVKFDVNLSISFEVDIDLDDPYDPYDPYAESITLASVAFSSSCK